jgi:hypothetical protein
LPRQPPEYEADPRHLDERLTGLHLPLVVSAQAPIPTPDTGKLLRIGRSRLFETSRVPAQPRLFGLDTLGEGGYLIAMRLERYPPRGPRRAAAEPQGVLFANADAL